MDAVTVYKKLKGRNLKNWGKKTKVISNVLEITAKSLPFFLECDKQTFFTLSELKRGKLE